MSGRLAYRKVLGSQKPADMLTKHVPADLLQAPELNTLEAIVVSWEEADNDEGAKENGGIKNQTGQKRVHFAPKIKFRAVPSANRGRECRGAARKEWQGHREPRAGGASLRGRPLWSDLEDDGSETAVDIFIES